MQYYSLQCSLAVSERLQAQFSALLLLLLLMWSRSALWKDADYQYRGSTPAHRCLAMLAYIRPAHLVVRRWPLPTLYDDC